MTYDQPSGERPRMMVVYGNGGPLLASGSTPIIPANVVRASLTILPLLGVGGKTAMRQTSPPL